MSLKRSENVAKDAGANVIDLNLSKKKSKLIMMNVLPVSKLK